MQVGLPPSESKSTQTENWVATYNRDTRSTRLTYDALLINVLSSREVTLNWLKELRLIASEQMCAVCSAPMLWTSCTDRLDAFRWECRRSVDGKRHKSVKSIRHNSWFAQSNLSIYEIIKFTYWWSAGLMQDQIRNQMSLATHTVVDWDMFCRETCSVAVYEDREILGGEGKIVQIDESKIGKRKYHRGHYVEGQWVFGGVEVGSRKSFIVCVEDRTEATLLSHIKEWIRPGTTIHSDCWKGYFNLALHGYQHQTVNHSLEYITEDGVHTNNIEGHWFHLKRSLPRHGTRKPHYESHIAEFIWRYSHRDEDLFFSFLAAIAKVYDPDQFQH